MNLQRPAAPHSECPNETILYRRHQVGGQFWFSYCNRFQALLPLKFPRLLNLIPKVLTIIPNGSLDYASDDQRLGFAAIQRIDKCS